MCTLYHMHVFELTLKYLIYNLKCFFFEKSDLKFKYFKNFIIFNEFLKKKWMF